MKQILDLELYVGTKEEYENAKSQGMKIVIALNRAKGYVTHQSIVGWEGKGCNKDNPFYLYKKTEEYIVLNLVDTKEEKYISDKLIDSALDFIKINLEEKNKVFIYCSLGESRSPSIALMYLLEQNLLENNTNVFEIFTQTIYTSYNPKDGFINYINRRWLENRN